MHIRDSLGPFARVASSILLIGSLLGIFSPAFAISDNQAASGLIGQYSDNLATTPSYNKSGADNGPNSYGFNYNGDKPDSYLDPVNHRFFFADNQNYRVMVFNLNPDNTFPDKIADYVIGHPSLNEIRTDFVAYAQDQLGAARGLAYDHDNNLLFVSQAVRITVFDLSGGITNGMNASYVLGQPNFSSSTLAHTQSGVVNTGAMVYSTSTKRLFVTELGNKVKVWDFNGGITNGMNASYVLGQADYTTGSAGNSTTTMNSPRGITLDDANQRLFVAETNGHRVKVFNVATSTIANGMEASYVIGQTTFSGASAGNSTSTLNSPTPVLFDSKNNRLFVGESGGHRVKVFNLSGGITNGMEASYVLGQTLFSTAAAATTRSGLSGSFALSYDPVNERLYVTGNNYRISVFDVNPATIANGSDAVDLLGQYTDDLTNLQPVYTKAGLNGGTGKYGLSAVTDVEIDATNRRMFISDTGNNRVLVHSLNSSNQLTDYAPDYVIGQANYYEAVATSTQSGLNVPRGLAFDANRNWLFVAEASGHRVKVFDLSSGITNGMNASYVLGQPDFLTATAGNSTTTLNAPWGIHFDPVKKYLYVAERSGHRVKVFDVDSITNGEEAIAVIGQAAFNTATAANTQTGIREPMDVDVDNTGNIVYVAEFSGHRVKSYDVTSLATTSEPAVNVLGQAGFTTATAANSQTGMNAVIAVRYDDENERLFVGEYSGHRVKVFDLSDGLTDNEAAVNILGQSLYTTATAANSQTGLNGVHGMYLDEANDVLYAAEGIASRIKLFDVSASSGGGGDSGGGGFSTVTVTTGSTVTTVASNGQPWYIVPATIASTTATSTATSTVSATSTATTTSATSTAPTVPLAERLFPLGKPEYTFAKTLTVRSQGEEVRKLQQFLNLMGFSVSNIGAGSVGKETTYFGPATRAALAKFQKAVGISPASGYFGPITRTFLNKLK